MSAFASGTRAHDQSSSAVAQREPRPARIGQAESGRRREPRIVALGGGTGLPIVLEGLKTALFPPHTPWDPGCNREWLTGIATAADDGGSSGRLRAMYGMPAPGDIRNCLVALAGTDPSTTAMFDFRFNGGDGVAGHSLGNLILTAFSELEQDFATAVERAARLLSIRGQVFPSTSTSVRLVAELVDGGTVEGESAIAATGRPIHRVRLAPQHTSAAPQACAALERADLVVIGPGSLYSSLVAVLLVEDLARAILRSRARVVLVMNLMTEPGESDGHTAADHVLAIRRHVPRLTIHDVLVNGAVIPRDRLDRYAIDAARPVALDLELLQAMGHRVIERDLIAEDTMIRHDPTRLARALMDIAEEICW
jgi:uncharacterized cofD-like protein